MSVMSDEFPSVSHKDSRSSAELLSLLFNLPNEKLIEDYSCAISESILLHGRMYVTYKAICFYSNIFGKETRKIIPFSMIDSIRKKTTAFLIPALEFVVRGRSKKGTRNVLFTSFLSHNRDSCYKLCVQLHRHYRPDVYSEDPMNTGGIDSPSGTPSRRQSSEKSNPAASSPVHVTPGKSPHPNRVSSSSQFNLTADSSSSSAHFHSPNPLENSGKQKHSKSIREAVTAIVASRRSTPDLSIQEHYPARMTPHRHDSQGSEFIQFGYFSPSSNDEGTHGFGSQVEYKDGTDDDGASTKNFSRSVNSPPDILRHSTSSRSMRVSHSQASTDQGHSSEQTTDMKSDIDETKQAISPSLTSSTAKPTVETLPLDDDGSIASSTIHNINTIDEEPVAVATHDEAASVRHSKTSGIDSVATYSTVVPNLTAYNADLHSIDNLSGDNTPPHTSAALPPSNGEAPKSFWTRLEGMTLLSDVCLPCTVEEFNIFFWSDDAKYSVLQFHESQGDKEVQSDGWKLIDSSSDTHTDLKSKTEEASIPPASTFFTRTIRLRMPLSIPLAPKETAVEKVQKLSRFAALIGESSGNSFDSTILCLDTVARSFDVPYGDHFVTEEVILLAPINAKVDIKDKSFPTNDAISAANEGPSQNKLCRLMHFVTLTFNKSTWFKGKITSETTSSVDTVGKAYINTLKKELAKLRENEALAAAAIERKNILVASAPVGSKVAFHGNGDGTTTDRSEYDKEEESEMANSRRESGNRHLGQEGMASAGYGIQLPPLGVVEDARGGIQSWAPSRSFASPAEGRRGLTRNTPKTTHGYKSSSFVADSQANSPSRHSIYAQDLSRSSSFVSPARRVASRSIAQPAAAGNQGGVVTHSRSSSTFAPTAHSGAEVPYITAEGTTHVRNRNGQLVDPLVEPFMTPEMAQRENRERLVRAYLQLFGGFQSVVSQIRVLQNEVVTMKKEKLELQERHAREMQEIKATLSSRFSAMINSLFSQFNEKVPFVSSMGSDSGLRVPLIIFWSLVIFVLSMLLVHVFSSPYSQFYFRFFGSETPTSSVAGLEASFPSGAFSESVLSDIPDEFLEKIISKLQQKLVSNAS